MQQLLIFVKLVKSFPQTSDVRTQPIGVCGVTGEDS